jgi:hypothetical protein
MFDRFASSQNGDAPQPELTGYFIAMLYFIALLGWVSVRALRNLHSRLTVHQFSAASRILFVSAGCDFRAALLQAVYNKALVAHTSTLDKIGPGQLSSYISVDAERICAAFELPVGLIQLPFMLVLGLAIIWQ